MTPSAPVTAGALERLASVEPAVRWAARMVAAGTGSRHEVRHAAQLTAEECWPATVGLPRGARELARRALASGRVARVVLPDERDEWLAIPHGSDVAVTVLGVRDLDAPGRSRLAEGIRSGAGSGVPLERAVLAAVAAHGDLESVALAVADAVAGATGCRRVSLGVERRGAMRLLAISGEARPDRRRDTVRCLQAVLDEVLANGRGASWPPPSMPARPAAAVPVPGDRDPAAGNPTDEPATSVDGTAHRQAHAGGALPLLSMLHPGPHGARVVAVLERAIGHPFAEDERAPLERELAPALALLGRLERGGAGRFERWSEAARASGRALRHGRPSRRWALAAVLIPVLVGTLVVPLPYRVSARVVVEASERQVLAAPYAGHVRSARARAGDTVAAGEVLATLDERELLLARDRWRGEADKNRAEQSRALAAHDRVELARLRADRTRLEAELALVEERRGRGTLRAPFDGIVIAGDPTRSLGAPVAAGEVLFEIAASERRSPLVEIDERDIAVIEPGARVRVRMAASPREVREARLDALVPVAVAETGRSIFRVPATFVEGADAGLSPGMQGVARVDAGRRSLAGAWTRTLGEKALLIGWSLGLVR